MDTIKALVLEETRNIVYKDIPFPEKSLEKKILVKIRAAGVCGSDLHRYAKGKVYHFPLVLGHEFSATVEEAPEESNFSQGDSVVVFPLVPDLKDPFSKIGEFGVSKGYDYFGSRCNGAFSEYLYVPEENILKIPEGISLLQAAMVEPAAVALHGVLKFDIVPNATALVIGGGAIGALAAQWLKIFGCTRIIVAEPDEKKRKILESIDLETINPLEKNTVEAIMTLTGGKGADLTIEACGIPLTFVQSLESAGTFGQVLFLGDLNGDLVLKDTIVSSILRKELKIYGAWNSKIMPVEKNEWSMVLNHMGKGLKVEPLISHIIQLEDGPAIFKQMADKEIWFNKVIFDIGGIS